MLRTVVTTLKKSWRLWVMAVVAVLVVAAYNMGEHLERHYRMLMERVHYGIAALILLASFYCIVLLVQTIWTTLRDDDHG